MATCSETHHLPRFTPRPLYVILISKYPNRKPGAAKDIFSRLIKEVGGISVEAFRHDPFYEDVPGDKAGFDLTGFLLFISGAIKGD